MRIANADVDMLLIAGFGPIVRDTAKSRKLYDDVLERRRGQTIFAVISAWAFLYASL